MSESKKAARYSADETVSSDDSGSMAGSKTISTRQRNLVFGIVNLSHIINHLESGMVSVLYPVMMQELGFGYFAIGVLQMTYQMTSTACQVIYGLLVRFFPRSFLLGTGNLLLGLFVMLTGFSQNFVQLTVLRGLAGMGSSAQHPVGAAILISYFEKARGRMLTLHHSLGNLGALLAPVVAGGLLLFTSWRVVFFSVAVLSLTMGISYFFLKETVVAAEDPESKGGAARASLRDYLNCLKNRDVMLVSLIQMTGAAGRGTGISVAFLTAFFMAHLGVNVSAAAGLLMIYHLSGLLGPLALGWLSDRFNRKWIVQFTLLGSTLTTLWLLAHESVTPWLLVNLVLYGGLIQSRGSLTQSMVSEAVPFEQMDIAFSLYFFIGFISGPVWTLLMGWLIDVRDFNIAFKVVSLSYLVGIVMLSFYRQRKVG